MEGNFKLDRREKVGLILRYLQGSRRFFLCALLFACLGMRNTYEKTMDFKPTVLNSLSTVILILYCVLSLSGVSVFLYFTF